MLPKIPPNTPQLILPISSIGQNILYMLKKRPYQASKVHKMFMVFFPNVADRLEISNYVWEKVRNDTLPRKESGSSRFCKHPRNGNVLEPKGPPAPAGFENLPISGLL